MEERAMDGFLEICKSIDFWKLLLRPWICRDSSLSFDGKVVVVTAAEEKFICWNEKGGVLAFLLNEEVEEL